jgi:hypothetical protein
VRLVQSTPADEEEGALLPTVALVRHVRVQVGNVRQAGSCARYSQLCSLRSGVCVGVPYQKFTQRYLQGGRYALNHIPSDGRPVVRV